MKAPGRWPAGLVVGGAVAFALGTLDPLEGSILVLAGAGLVALGTWYGPHSRGMRLYWSWVFGTILFGVVALWWLSALGGVGGRSGRSAWWLLVCLPYPVGWLLGSGGLLLRAVRAVVRRRALGAPAP